MGDHRSSQVRDVVVQCFDYSWIGVIEFMDGEGHSLRAEVYYCDDFCFIFISMIDG